MKPCLVALAMVALLFSSISAISANNVVVVPLSSSDRGVKVYDNDGQYLGILVGSDNYIKIFNPTLNLTIALKKLDLSLPAVTFTWCYANCSSVQPYTYASNEAYAGFLLLNTHNNPDTYFSLQIPASYQDLISIRGHNGTDPCSGLWTEGSFFQIKEYAAADLPITFPVSAPLHYR